MFKNMQIKLNSIALSVVNVGRPHGGVVCDTSDGGLLQSILGGFDSANQPLIVVKINGEGNEFSSEQCIAHTRKVLADIDFGMTEGETPTEKTKDVFVSMDDDQERKYTVIPSQLHLPDNFKPKYLVLGGNHRVLNALVSGSLQGGNYQQAHCNVYENYADGVAAAVKENGHKDTGVRPLGKMDNILMVQRGLTDFTIKRECDLKKKMSITSRNMRQSVFGPAVKGLNIPELQDQLMAGELDCVHTQLPVARLNQKIGPKFMECNNIKQVTSMLEKEVPVAGAKAGKALSGEAIRTMASLLVEDLGLLLNHIADGESGEAYAAAERCNTALKAEAIRRNDELNARAKA